jgi:hypothetical protein
MEETEILLGKIKSQTEEMLKSKGFTNKAEVDAQVAEKMKAYEGLDAVKLKGFLDEKTGIMAILKTQGEEINALKEKAANPDQLSIKSQVKTWVEANKDALFKIKSGMKVDLTPLEVKAADSPMTPTTVFTNTQALGAGALIRNAGASVMDLLRIQPTLWDLLPKGRTNLETYPWVNKKVPADSGAADFLAPGAAKPKVSFTLQTEKSNAKKVAVSMKVATELLEDIDGMVSYIENELSYQLKYEVNRVIMSASAGSATDPAGIRNYANAYTLTGIQTANPNNWDVARAVVAQIRAGFVDGPILIGMNPVDTANMEMDKAISQGQYLGLNLRPVPGGFIYEDYNITAGDILGFAPDLLKTLIYKDFRIAYGWENDDFTKNLVTAIAETRFHQFHSDNHAAAFVYDQISDIKTAIAIA